MNDALLKFLNFIGANFWDWQFFLFVFFAGLAFCFFILNREKSLGHNRIFELVFEKTGKSDAINYFLIFAANIFVIFMLVLITGIPVPQTHDEFGYLLAADTFLHGRLANPTPFSPEHFEFFHILLEPVYAAKFPPLQGFFLAVGTFLSGFPITGVWLSCLLSSVANYWLLRAIFSLRRSLFGTLLWIFAPLNFVWCDSYWGGHIAVIGGALSAGAFFRYLKYGYLKYLFIWGLGIFLLLNSRLYEGTVLTGILVLLWLFELAKSKKKAKEIYRHIAAFILIIFINLLWIGFYNYSVTQNPLVLPYSLQHSQYHRVPLFIFQSENEPKANIPLIIKKLDDRWVAEFRENYANPLQATVSTFEKTPIYLVWLTRSPFLLTFFLFGLFTFFKEGEKIFCGKIPVILTVFLGALFLTTFKGDRFIAPVVGLIFVLITSAGVWLYRKNVYWRYFVLPLPLIVGGGFILGMLSLELKKNTIPAIENNLQSRREIVEYLTAQGGRHLVFLETAETNPADARFYVYNEAEIEEASIIWVHNLSRSQNRLLIEHYGNRKIWLLKFTNFQAVLMEYSDKN